MSVDQLTASLSALSDPTRRAIIAYLADGEATVSDLVDRFDLTQPTISSHIRVLQRAGLISRTRVAQTRPCRLNPAGLKPVAEWLSQYERFFEGAIDRFADHAERQTEAKRKDRADG